MQAFEAEVSSLLGSAPAGTLLERIHFFSQAFLDRPYLVGANGEGEQGEFDQSPLFRTDFFDCLTYVNTVLALMLSENLEDFRHHIVQVNYRDARPAYENRYHFMSIDWNPGNKALGIVAELTKKLGISVDIAETMINRAEFFQHKQFQDLKRLQALSFEDEDQLLKDFRSLGKDLSSEPSKLAYLSLKNLFNDHQGRGVFFEKLPLVSLVEIVRPNWDLQESIGTHLNVSHIGFLFKQKENKLMFRHASLKPGKVLEVNFWEYLEAFKSSPTIKGISVWGIILDSAVHAHCKGLRQNKCRLRLLDVARR